jgi:hypothetical protein
MMRSFLFLMLVTGCNPDPGEADQQVTYRDGLDPSGNSGERGTVRVSELLWSGSVTDDGTWDPDDQFIELRNEGNRPVLLSGWQLKVRGGVEATWPLPDLDETLDPGQHMFIAAKDTGCFPNPNLVLPGMRLPQGDPISVTLQDLDEHLIDSAGSYEDPPYAGGYDWVVSRSMEKIEIMFGGKGQAPESWHFYTRTEVEVPNNDRVAEDCRNKTLASPGRPNSPDYSGAYATGAFE